MEGSPATPDAAHMFAQMKQVEVLSFQDEQVFSRLAQADIVVDAVYGIGFRGSMREEFTPIVEAINQSKAPIFAVDLPSGCLSYTSVWQTNGSYPSGDRPLSFGHGKEWYGQPGLSACRFRARGTGDAQ